MFETAMKKNPKDWRAMAQKLGKSHSEVTYYAIVSHSWNVCHDGSLGDRLLLLLAHEPALH